MRHLWRMIQLRSFLCARRVVRRVARTVGLYAADERALRHALRSAHTYQHYVETSGALPGRLALRKKLRGGARELVSALMVAVRPDPTAAQVMALREAQP